MYIEGESSRMEISLLRRSYPDSTDYWDGNWVSSEINISIPGISVSVPFELRTDELIGFLDSLTKVKNGSGNEFEMRTLEDGLYIKGEVELTGSIIWHCRITYPIGDGANLNFRFNSDLNQMESLIQQLKKELITYPVIGTP
jgi:hypothetical protein